MGKKHIEVEEQAQFEEMEAVSIDCAFKSLNSERRKEREGNDTGRKIIRREVLI